jgi:hypothetical protein
MGQDPTPFLSLTKRVEAAFADACSRHLMGVNMIRISLLSLFLAFGLTAHATVPAQAATKQQAKPQDKSKDKAACYRAANKLKGRREKERAVQACG